MTYRMPAPITGTDFQFIRSAVDTLRLVPSGIDGRCRIPVADTADSGGMWVIELDAYLECDISASGAGGLDTGSEAASTCYECRLITKPYGVDPALVFTLSGNNLTYPSGYTMSSKVLWGVTNDSGGDLLKFFWAGPGTCIYADLGDAPVITNGTEYSSYALINNNVFAPREAVRVTYEATFDIGTGTTARYCLLTYNSGGTELAARSTYVCNNPGTTEHPAIRREQLTLYGNAQKIYYAWTGVGGGTWGLTLNVIGWQIPLPC